MSTRAEIIIKDEKYTNRLYHHHDGYISGVGFDLLNRYAEKLDNPEIYLDIDDIATELVKDASDEYEISAYPHGDIEYSYTIDLIKREITAKGGYVNDDGEFKTKHEYSYQYIKDSYKNELLQKNNITICNDWDEHKNRYWYVCIGDDPYIDPDGNGRRFDSFDKAVEFALNNIVDE